jgi:ribosomal protein S18 acetylase RimI-like enzyme
MTHAAPEPERSDVEINGVTYQFREIGVDDVDEMHQLDTLCFSEQRVFTRGYFLLLFYYDRAFGHALEKNGELIALVLYTRKRHNANVATVDVHPDWRRRGLAEALLVMGEEELKRRGIRSVSLQVGTDNESAQRLYDKLGYTRTHLLKNYYPDGDALQMRKRLVPQPLRGIDGGAGAEA